MPFLAAIALGLTACASVQGSSVTGVITDLDAASLTSVRAFSLRDAQGNTWQFTVAEDAADEQGRPLNASHVRQDMAQGLQFTVDFRREGDGLVAQRVAH